MKPPKFEDYDPFKPEKKRRPLLKLFLAVSLVGAGCAGYGLYRLSRTTPAAPAILPAETPAFMSFTPGLAALGGLPLLKRAYPQFFSWQGFQDFKARLKLDLGLDFEQDVVPWLGPEIDLAFSEGRTRTASTSDLPTRATLLFASRNDGRARDALAKVRIARQAKGEDATPETYEGVAYDIYPGGQALGVVGGFVVWANTEGAFHAIVDRAAHREGSTLATEPEYQALLGQLPGDAVGRFFVSQHAAKEAMPTMPVPGDTGWVLDAYRGLAGGVALHRDEISLHTVAHLDPARLPEALRANLAATRLAVDPHLMDVLPAQSISACSFRLPPGTAAAAKKLAVEMLRSHPDVGRAQQEAGVDLERDLAAWLEGELVVGLVPAKDDPALPVELAMVMKPTDPKAAAEGIGHLRQAWTKKMEPALPGGYRVPAPYGFQTKPHDGIPWQVMHDTVHDKDLGGYAVTEDRVYLAYGATTLAEVGKPPVPLTAAPVFKAATGSLPRPNGGVAFLDVAAGFTLAMPYLGKAADDLEKAIRPVTAVAAAGTPGLTDQGFMRSTFVARIEEARKEPR